MTPKGVIKALQALELVQIPILAQNLNIFGLFMHKHGLKKQ